MLFMMWLTLSPAAALRVSSTICSPDPEIEPDTRAMLEEQVKHTALCWWGQGGNSWWARGSTDDLNALLIRLARLHSGFDGVRPVVVLHRGTPDLARWGESLPMERRPNWRLDFHPHVENGRPKGRLASVRVHVWLGGEIEGDQLAILTDKIVAQRVFVAVGREEVGAVIDRLEARE